MQTYAVALNQEQLKLLKGLYICFDSDDLNPVVSSPCPTIDTLRIAIPDSEIILTAYDFKREEEDGDRDFIYFDEWGDRHLLFRDDIPEEVVEILDAAIDEEENKKEVN